MNKDYKGIITKYANKNVYIEILADGYKIEGMGVCWRGYVHWKDNNKWKSEDCGCASDWGISFSLCEDFIEKYII